MPKLTLHPTYYQQGFFNVSVDYDKSVRPTDGQIELILGLSGRTIPGTVNRRANRNGTARVTGGRKLRDWFQENYALGDVIEVQFSPVSITLGGGIRGREAPDQDTPATPPRGPVAGPRGGEDVDADELARWRRGLVRLLAKLDDPDSEQRGLAARINHLSHAGRIPRTIAACMKVVAEARNQSEYEARLPSRTEGAAVRSAWTAVVEWARSVHLDLD